MTGIFLVPRLNSVTFEQSLQNTQAGQAESRAKETVNAANDLMQLGENLEEVINRLNL